MVSLQNGDTRGGPPPPPFSNATKMMHNAIHVTLSIFLRVPLHNYIVFESYLLAASIY